MYKMSIAMDQEMESFFEVDENNIHAYRQAISNGQCNDATQSDTDPCIDNYEQIADKDLPSEEFKYASKDVHSENSLSNFVTDTKKIYAISKSQNNSRVGAYNLVYCDYTDENYYLVCKNTGTNADPKVIYYLNSSVKAVLSIGLLIFLSIFTMF